MRTLRCRSLPLAVRLLALLLALAGLSGCGGSSSPGSSNGPAPLPAVTGLNFTLIPMVNNGTVVEFQWAGSGASSYRLEIGSSSGASNVAIFDTAGAVTTFSWTGVPVGNFYARVKGLQGTTVGPASAEVLVGSVDARQVVDALIFGSGPLAVAGNAAGPLLQDRMEGWQPNTGFDVILGDSLPAAAATSAEKTAQQIGPATKGIVRAGVLGRRPDPLPVPRPGQVTISMLSAEDVRIECECDDCVGCSSSWLLGSFIQRGQIFVSDESDEATAAHELGHAIGLGHIITAAGVRPPFTMGLTTDGQFSPRGQLDVLDPATIRMLETVYGAGMTAGSSRRQFEAAGLVPPETAGLRPRIASDRGTRVRQDGNETVVTRRLCQERRTEP